MCCVKNHSSVHVRTRCLSRFNEEMMKSTGCTGCVWAIGLGVKMKKNSQSKKRKNAFKVYQKHVGKRFAQKHTAHHQNKQQTNHTQRETWLWQLWTVAKTCQRCHKTFRLLLENWRRRETFSTAMTKNGFTRRLSPALNLIKEVQGDQVNEKVTRGCVLKYHRSFSYRICYQSGPAASKGCHCAILFFPL